MTRYTATLTHIPGHGHCDHLFDVFVCAVAHRLAPQGCADKDALRRAMVRIHDEARAVSGFDGQYTWKIHAV